MTETSDCGRQLRARYAFGGAAVELKRAVPLAPDEEVSFHGAMRLRGQGLLPRPAVLRLTRARLVVLAHYAFQRDRVWDVPRTAIQGVEMTRGAVQITWTDEHAVRQIMLLSRWTGRAAMDRPVRDAQVVAELLVRWLAGGDGSAFRASPPSHEAP